MEFANIPSGKSNVATQNHCIKTLFPHQKVHLKRLIAGG
jgi:hypothetical protein